MKKLTLACLSLFVFSSYASDYTESLCFQSFKASADEMRAKIKDKEDNGTFFEGIAGFFCSLDKAAAHSKYAPAMTNYNPSDRYLDCDNPIDYSRQINTQIAINFSYADAHLAKAMSDPHCGYGSPCKKSMFGKKSKNITGSMDFAKEVYLKIKSINPDISSWKPIQSVVQNGFQSGALCKNNGKPKSLRKVMAYIYEQFENQSVQNPKAAEDSDRSEKGVESLNKTTTSENENGSISE